MMFDKENPIEFVTYIPFVDNVNASQWCIDNDITYLSFNVDWHNFRRPIDTTGYCFLNEDDRLLFALRWA